MAQVAPESGAPAQPSCCRRIWLSFLDEPEGERTLAQHFFTGKSLDRRAIRQESKRPGTLQRQDSILEAPVDGLAVEDKLDYWPIFLGLQALLALLLWVIGAAQSEESFWTATAGLDTLFPDMTKMVVHKDCSDLRWEMWRWLAYQYTHSGLSHVGLNIFMILVVGARNEMYHGHWRTIAIFNLGVVCSAISFAFVDGHATLVGMSGGIYALMGMNFGSLILNWSDMRYRYPELTALFVVFLLDLTFAIVDSQDPESETSHSAHIGGYGAGFVLGILMGRNLDEEEEAEHAQTLQYERYLQAVVAVIGFAALLFLVVWMAQWPPRTMLDSTPWCWGRQVFNQSMFPEFRYHCVRCQDDSCIASFRTMANVDEVSFRVCGQLGWSYSQEGR